MRKGWYTELCSQNQMAVGQQWWLGQNLRNSSSLTQIGSDACCEYSGKPQKGYDEQWFNLFIFNFLFYIGVQLINNVALV